MNDDVLIKVENVSKKFCRSLKKSLWYGVKDLTSEALGRSRKQDKLRRDEFWAVDDVSFELPRGELVGFHLQICGPKLDRRFEKVWT